MIPEVLEIKDPPIIVIRIKNNETSKLEEYIDMPEVETDEITANKMLKIPSSAERKRLMRLNKVMRIKTN